MHDSLNASAGRVSACDDRPDRIGAWLRRASTTLAALWYFNYCWPAGTRLLSAFATMLANARARWLHGRTAVARPSRSGGVDHGLRAVMRGANPMVFGGDPHAAASCNARRTKGKQVRVVVDETSTGWVATRRAIASMFFMRWPASCSAMEATR